MVDDVKVITETAESKDAIDRARLARERREAEQRKRLDELRAHAAAAQAQREKRDEDRRRRQAEQRARDEDRRQQVEERKRAIWEASISRRESLLQREKDRTERLERARAARSAPRPAFAFGSSTPRLLEPLDSSGFFWAARSTNPIDQMNFFESLAASTTNVMYASAPLTRRASALQLDSSDIDNKDEADRHTQPVMWSSVARRRTDLVPTLPASRAPGRAYSMTRLDRLGSRPSTAQLNQPASGESTPSRPGSALSVSRRAPAARRPRPASIAGTGVHTPRAGVDGGCSAVSSPAVSRDHTSVTRDYTSASRDTVTPRDTARRHRPASMIILSPGEGKPPPHRKPKPSKENDKTPRGKSLSASPGRALSPSPRASKEPSQDKEIVKPLAPAVDTSGVQAHEVTQKLEALQVTNGHHTHNVLINEKQNIEDVVIKSITEKVVEKVSEVIEPQKPVDKPNINIEHKAEEKKEIANEQGEIKTEIEKQKEPSIEKQKEPSIEKQKEPSIEKQKEPSIEKQKEPSVEKKELDDKREEKKEPSQEKTEENEMTASMSRRITTEQQAKAALAERRRRAREEAERQAELQRLRLEREAEEEAERQRQEEERQRREEEEARELARLQRAMEEEKLRKAIEAQQELERQEAEKRARAEQERLARRAEEEDKRAAAAEAERARRREEAERLARKQRVEAIMARTRLAKQNEEEKKQQQSASNSDNGNSHSSQAAEASPPAEAEPSAPAPAPANGNVADLLGLSDTNHTEDKPQEPPAKQIEPETNNGNVQLPPTNVGHISANFIQTERLAEAKLAEPAIIEDDYTTHNGHGTHNHPLTLQNAI